MHIPVPWVFILTYLVGVVLELWFPLFAKPGKPAALIFAGAGLLVLGAIIAGWSLWLFHKARTTTIPGRMSKSLVTGGPYRLTRNPMYVGLCLAYLGEAGILRQVWPVLLLPITLAYLNWIVIPVEEAKLTEAFGADYEQYRAAVRRWL